MVNKEKLLLLAAIYMLLPGAMPDALADATETEKSKTKKTPALHKMDALKNSDRQARKSTRTGKS